MRATQPRSRPTAFTLPELLVVVSIIVIVTAIAIPSIRALSGNRSTESAHNQLAGLLGRARGEAIALQEVHGVAFFTDRETQRVVAYIVRQTEAPTVPTIPMGYFTDFPGYGINLYLDYVADRDPVLMPNGVGIQMVDDTRVNTQGTPTPADDVRIDDAYIGFNTAEANGQNVTFGGVILFDGYGRVISKRYAFKCYTEPLAGTKAPTAFAKTWEMVDPMTPNSMPAAAEDLYPRGNPRSQFGFVAFDEEAYQAVNLVGGTAGAGKLSDLYADPFALVPPIAYDGTANPMTGTTEAAEEKWLDENGIPELVNRSNGTLTRSE